MKKWISVLLILILLLPSPVLAEESEVQKALKTTSDYMLSVDTNPTRGSEWFVIGLARYGLDLEHEYFSTYYKNVEDYLKENKGDLQAGRRFTDYSKLIITVTAMGKDARNVAGYNLLENISDFENVQYQGLNGPIWALIALKSNPEYTFPTNPEAKIQNSEEVLVQAILDAEVKGGGWTLYGEEPDTDMTGMAIQSLASYYHKDGYEKVTEAIDRAVERLSKMQLESGGFGTMGIETSESNAQVITALSSIGIDIGKDARFNKNGHTPIENMLSYRIDGGFMHVRAGAENNGGGEAGELNGMATEQGFYSLVAYERFLEGKNALYDMSSEKQVESEKSEAGTSAKQPKDVTTNQITPAPLTVDTTALIILGLSALALCIVAVGSRKKEG
ncbi:putative surface/cell-adhesion protein [Lachnospiraceae bacterium TWA4]|nr:putative surface/cell-adhesion protein [Lachnospiraceae bacterium TWA4]